MMNTNVITHSMLNILIVILIVIIIISGVFIFTLKHIFEIISAFVFPELNAEIVTNPT